MVRENTDYGINIFVDNEDGTITDNATGLMWQQADDGTTRNWENALQYCENLTHAGYSDWRLPNAKELHSIIDYTRCPDVTNSPAIDPLFSCTSFNNPDGDPNYGYYWTSSPLMDGPRPYTDAVYISFGEAQGQMSFPPDNTPALYDTHGAGATRNDPKEIGTGTYPRYFGPQGDILYVNNYVRAVRDVSNASSIKDILENDLKIYPNPASRYITVSNGNTIENISIYTIHGAKVMDINPDVKWKKLDISQLTNGTYLISVRDDLGNTFSQKVMVNTSL